jgi:hypothetical protein
MLSCDAAPKAASFLYTQSSRSAPWLAYCGKPTCLLKNSLPLCKKAMPNPAIDRSAQRRCRWVPVALRALAPGHCERSASRRVRRYTPDN